MSALCFPAERLHTVGLFRVGPSGDEVGGGQVGGSSFQFLMTKKMRMKKDGGAFFLFSLSPLVSSRSFDLILFF